MSSTTLAILVGVLGTVVVGFLLKYFKNLIPKEIAKKLGLHKNDRKGDDDNYIKTIESVEVEKIENDNSKKKEVSSSKGNIKKIQERIKRLLGLLLLPALFLFPINNTISRELTQAEREEIIKYFENTVEYVNLVEKELSTLRNNLRKDTKINTEINEDGSEITIEVIIPTKQPIITEEKAKLVEAPSITRRFKIKPEIIVQRKNEKEGFELFTGIMVGASIDTKERMEPMVGVEILSYHMYPITLSSFLFIDINSWGGGIGAGPSDDPNLRIFTVFGRDFGSDGDFTFKGGISALVNW